MEAVYEFTFIPDWKSTENSGSMHDLKVKKGIPETFIIDNVEKPKYEDFNDKDKQIPSEAKLGIAPTKIENTYNWSIHTIGIP